MHLTRYCSHCHPCSLCFYVLFQFCRYLVVLLHCTNHAAAPLLASHGRSILVLAHSSSNPWYDVILWRIDSGSPSMEIPFSTHSSSIPFYLSSIFQSSLTFYSEGHLFDICMKHIICACISAIMLPVAYVSTSNLTA